MLNQSILIGRLTRDPEIRYSQQNNMEIARFTIAVERDYRPQGQEAETDFISCVAFGKTAEFVERYFGKGNMICVTGRIQTGSYTNKDGKNVYTTDINVERVNFTGEKREDAQRPAPQQQKVDKDGFMNIPDDISEELPFC